MAPCRESRSTGSARVCIDLARLLRLTSILCLTGARVEDEIFWSASQVIGTHSWLWKVRAAWQPDARPSAGVHKRADDSDCARAPCFLGGMSLCTLTLPPSRHKRGLLVAIMKIIKWFPRRACLPRRVAPRMMATTVCRVAGDRIDELQ